MEPQLRFVVVNLDDGVEDYLDVPLSVERERSVRFVGLPEGRYESYVSVTGHEAAKLEEHTVAELRLFVTPEWTQGF